MKQHGLAAEWTFRFHARWNGNICCHAKKLITIGMPRALGCDISEVRFILSHEIAHALVGPGHDHDDVWRAKDLSIGGKGERYLDDEAESRPLTDGEIATLVYESGAQPPLWYKF
jgi:hypothetical protein